MQTVPSSTELVNPGFAPKGLPLSQQSASELVELDATIDATDIGHRFGYEDATEGRDQAPSAFFFPGTPSWHAYNEGYKEGCIHLAVLTGISRPYTEL